MTITSEIFSSLNAFTEPELQHQIVSNGKIIKASKNDVLVREGQHLNFLPIVIKGLLRVYQETDDREILLYYVGPGETCMMSLSSAYFDYNSAANGMAVEPSEILVLPAFLIAEWQLRFPSWNQFIIKTFRSRYDELLKSFGNVAFKPVNERVKDYLEGYSKSQSTKQVPLSHQALANELGTTRVVISRILKQMEQDGVVKLHRGYIQLPG